MKPKTITRLLPALAVAILLVGCQSIGVATPTPARPVGTSATPSTPPAVRTTNPEDSPGIAVSPSSVATPGAARTDIRDGRPTASAPDAVPPAGSAMPDVLATPTVAGPESTGSGPLPIPLRVRIPRIHVDASVEAVGMDADGTMGTPRTVDDVGWYGYGPIPGEPGASVLAGHVDSVRGPAIFWSLHELRPGDRIDVDLVGGVTRHFVVEGVGTYPSDEAPISTIFALAGPPRLNLITCGGIFDRARRAYDQRLVVYARLDTPSAPHPAPGPAAATGSNPVAETTTTADGSGAFLAHVADAASGGGSAACISTGGRCE